MLMKADGSGLRTIVPPKKDAFAANGYWTPNGEGILFIGKDAGGSTELRRYDRPTGRSHRIAGPRGMWLSDPHQVGGTDRLCRPRIPKSKKKNTIWMMDHDGRNARQITNPAPD